MKLREKQLVKRRLRFFHGIFILTKFGVLSNKKKIIRFWIKFCLEKGVFTYEKVKDLYSLNSVPKDGQFFFNFDFFSLLKKENITKNKFEKSKCLFKNLNIRNLSGFNDLYNFLRFCYTV